MTYLQTPLLKTFEREEIERLKAKKLASDVPDVEGDAAAASAKKDEKKDDKAKKGDDKKKAKKKQMDTVYEIQPFRVGDSVDVHYKIVEGDKERVQVFGGTVIRHKGTGLGENFTIRRLVDGEGVERIFPMQSPKLIKVVIKRKGKVRRSRLYYLRHRIGKAAKTKELVEGAQTASAGKPVAAPATPTQPPATPAQPQPPQ